ncbi:MULTISPECIES: TetR/AcrR family transcriptional regulator [Lysinibacillus]|uniref:TetR/AcrR family transcriptional regulator n=1 Tax=Lysinibacillus TaxID=400634 RepID=UPI001C8B3496|nr:MULTISPECIES: TetR/AcrR family transcriptional regulator [Lysinibacillus]WHP43517.1 TetR/AcrR family transcriptional regulator [Lysinibacillus boronitolerans]MBX8944109.1 TetR/AcrR family transcriptional regulator [Lysinibacillus sp. K60]UNT54179.1 TetR/AcrR family transcriptional regulator [Lysinibacillus capsici]UUV26187.1 TetR/AcrR family transcriptional regulator [Lysinibacillus sp. FN11]UYB49060.1 TetR/AcrR family transcriptional regulator [Lysinibacillus capsici]
MAKPMGKSKQELVQAAMQCLVDNGIGNFTLKLVASYADVTQGTIYYHFKTKEQILLEIIKFICEDSWGKLLANDQFTISAALESVKSRYENDVFYHKLLIALVALGFNNRLIKEQLGQVLTNENDSLLIGLKRIWKSSPIKGVSLTTWSIFFNALIDGIAIQLVTCENFPLDTFYEELEKILNTIHQLDN